MMEDQLDFLAGHDVVVAWISHMDKVALWLPSSTHHGPELAAFTRRASLSSAQRR
jgi:hypothetical protein